MTGHSRLYDERAVLTASGAVNRYCKKYKADVPSIYLNLHGYQSAGKSRYLNAFAGRALGMMDRSTGTRCPVLYEFRTVNTANEERCTVTWKGVETIVAADAVHAAVTRVMQEIGRQFSMETLFVTIELQSALTICVTDVPGLLPQNSASAEQDNPVITAMWRKFSAEPSSVPVFVTQMYADWQRTESEVEGVRLAIGASREALSRAIVIVGRLDDHARADDCRERMDAMARVLREKGISSPERTVFLSLKPELYNRVASEAPEPTDNAVLSEYFRGLLALDRQMMDEHLLPHLNRNGGVAGLRIGLAEAIGVMTRTVSDHLKHNFASIMQQLTTKFEELREEMRVLGNLLDAHRLRRDALSFVRLYTAYLGGLSRWDMSRLQAALGEVSGDNGAQPPRDVALPAKCAYTLDEEMAELQMLESPFAKLCVALRDEMDAGALGPLLKRKLFGGSALLRLLRVWQYVVLREKWEQYDTDELQRLGSMTDANRVRGWVLEYCLRKMVEASGGTVVEETLLGVAVWAERLFVLHGNLASCEVRNLTPLLRNALPLQKQLCDEMRASYEEHLGVLLRRSSTVVTSLVKAYFSTLVLDAPFQPLRLACSNPATNVIHEGVEKAMVPSALKDTVQRLLRAGGTLRPNEVAQQLFASCAAMRGVVKAEHVAMGAGVKLERVEDTELEAMKLYINDVARMLSYLHRGMAMVRATSAFDANLEQPVKQLPEKVEVHLNRVLQQVPDDALVLMAMGDAAERLRKAEALLDEVRDNYATQEGMRDAARELQEGLSGSGTLQADFDMTEQGLTALVERLRPLSGAATELHSVALALQCRAADGDAAEQHRTNMITAECSGLRETVRSGDREVSRVAQELRQSEERRLDLAKEILELEQRLGLVTMAAPEARAEPETDAAAAQQHSDPHADDVADEWTSVSPNTTGPAPVAPPPTDQGQQEAAVAQAAGGVVAQNPSGDGAVTAEPGETARRRGRRVGGGGGSP